MDLNADIGEDTSEAGSALDLALLQYITSANIACGYHAGDPNTMSLLSERCARLGIRIGAHVSYDDREGFGRRPIKVKPEVLLSQVRYQIGALSCIATSAGGWLSHIKPHGALYSSCFSNEDEASVIVEAISSWNDAIRRPSEVPQLRIVCQPGSCIHRIAMARSVPAILEGYADRTYLPDGRLSPRSVDGSVISEPATAAKQAKALMSGDAILNGPNPLKLPKVDSICIHSDTENALEIARAVSASICEVAGVVTSWD